MTSRLLIVLGLLLFESPIRAGDHGTERPPSGRAAASGPCEGIDEEVGKLILTEAEKSTAKLYVATALFAARYKEVGETPAVKAFQLRARHSGEAGAARAAEASLLAGHVFIVGGVSSLFLWTALDKTPGVELSRSLVYAGGSLLSSLPVTFSVADVLRDRDTARARADRDGLAKLVTARLAEETEHYAELFQWDATQREKFNRRLAQEGVKILRESLPFNPGPPAQHVRLVEVDPIALLEEMHPDRRDEIATLRALARLQEQASKAVGNDPKRALPPTRTLRQHLMSLRRAARIYGEVNRDLPPGSSAHKEGKRLQQRIEAAERRLHELCALQGIKGEDQ